MEGERASKKRQVTILMQYIDRYISENEVGKVKERIEKMKALFGEFEDLHWKIHADIKDQTKIEESEDYFFKYQTEYTSTMNKAGEWVRSFEDEKKEQKPTLNPNDALALSTLPKVEIDTYDGDPLTFHNFMALFDDAVDSLLVNGRAKLMRLLQYTKGEAKEAIQSCILIDGEDGYTEARAILKKRFGNDHLVLERIVHKLRRGSPVKSPRELQLLATDLQNCEKTLSQMGKLSEVDNRFCIAEVVERLQHYLQVQWKRLSMKFKREHDAYPSFKELVAFISDEADGATDPVFGKIGQRSQEKSTQRSHSSKPSTTFATNVKQSEKTRRSLSCVACAGDHKTLYCNSFRQMKIADRLRLVEDHNLCKNCLMKNHKTDDCKKEYRCTVFGCGQKHSSFIHVHVPQRAPDEVRSSTFDNRVISANTSAGKVVHLPILSVRVNDSIEANVILDTASSNSFCSSKLANRLNLVQQNVDYELSTLHGCTEKCAKVVELNVTSLDNENELRMSNVIVIDEIPATSRSIDVHEYRYLADLPLVAAGQKVDVLIGQDYAEALLPLEVRQGERCEPFAVRTLLGWSVNGPARPSGAMNRKVVSHFISASVLEDQVSAMWDIESDPCFSDECCLSYEDRTVMNLWSESCTKVNGRYELPIPWRSDVKLMGNVKMAMCRLKSLKSNLMKRSLTDSYEAEIRKLLTQGYAEAVPDDEVYKSEKIWYLPHHAVISDRKPGKMRIVFDCAAKFDGESLNDKCLKGPDLNNKLLHVLLRFRQFRYAITSDVEAMYYQVLIPSEDRDALRFLWFDKDGNLLHYRMTRHVFGGIWCSASSTFALRRVLAEFPDTDPVVVDTIMKSFYVDDCLRSVDHKDDAFRIIHGTKDLLARGGFRLTKFVANDPDLLASIPEEDRAGGVKDLRDSKALGVTWHVSDDNFSFDVDIRDSHSITRRVILSVVSSVFDPLGLVSPVILLGRLIFQEATRIKLAWDDVVPVELQRRWRAWIDDLLQLRNIRIPRCVTVTAEEDTMFELHHFSDASSKAYGCCSYLRGIDKNGRIHTSLLMSKNRVAPLKNVSIPRLELQGAVMSAKIDCLLRKELDLHISQSHFWTDSEIVLKYIANETSRFNVYVGNRVSLIRELTDVRQWNFIRGKMNPADVVSRGESSSSFPFEEWFSGPAFLKSYKSDWSVNRCDLTLFEGDPGVKDLGKTSCMATSVASSDHPIERMLGHYSDWYKLKRAVAWLLRLPKLLKGDEHIHGRMSVEEIKRAEIHILKYMQSKYFGEELQRISEGFPIRKSSRLNDLDPFLDDDGLLRVGGRLKHAKLSGDRKNPYIVHCDDPAAHLILQEVHNVAHLGLEWVVHEVRRKFWITQIRRVAKKVAHRCFTCRRLFAAPRSQKMADHIPDAVQAGNPPFTFTGLDCFGPFIVKRGRSELKRYGCIFTCLNVRAVHLEKLESLDADSFLNAFRRFISRRGMPKKIWSDNGTNFVGANAELRRAMQELRNSEMHDYATKMEIEWNFNPPNASHMGGSWERLIRIVRKVLTGMGNVNSRITDEILDTVFCEAEAIINGRPITKPSEDAKDLRPLTPNHLLLMRGQPSFPPGKFSDADLYKRRWRCVQFISQEFWRRWRKEYLLELQRRSKWRKVEKNLKVGDIVLIMGENTPRSVWPMGFVNEVRHGTDGLVRSAVIKTNSSVLVRPITKLVLLEES